MPVPVPSTGKPGRVPDADWDLHCLCVLLQKDLRSFGGSVSCFHTTKPDTAATLQLKVHQAQRMWEIMQWVGSEDNLRYLLRALWCLGCEMLMHSSQLFHCFVSRIRADEELKLWLV